jgi:hypothetical protein
VPIREQRFSRASRLAAGDFPTFLSEGAATSYRDVVSGGVLRQAEWTRNILTPLLSATWSGVGRVGTAAAMESAVHMLGKFQEPITNK